MQKRMVVQVILDRSGSMASRRDDVIGGFNEYLAGLKETHGVEVIFSLTQFDDVINTVYWNSPVRSVPNLTPLTFVPRGLTALYDAICTTIRDLEGSTTHNDAVIVVIMTDGFENASKRFTASQVKEMIQGKEAAGNWTFVYLGANQDAWAVGSLLGLQANNVRSYNVDNYAGTFKSLGDSSRGFASRVASNVGMSTQDFWTPAPASR